MVAEQGSEKVLAREYELQFKGYDPGLVDAAATAVIGEAGRSFPPKPGEIKAAVQAEFARRIGSQRPPHRAEPLKELTPAEVAKRKADCARWRKQYGLDKIDVEATTEEKPWRPLSETELENLSALMARGRG